MQEIKGFAKAVAEKLFPTLFGTEGLEQGLFLHVPIVYERDMAQWMSILDDFNYAKTYGEDHVYEFLLRAALTPDMAMEIKELDEFEQVPTMLKRVKSDFEYSVCYF